MQNKPSATLRTLAILIDLAMLALLILPFVVVCMFLKVSDNIFFHAFAFSLFFALVICKDMVGGRSFGKRKLQMEIVSTRGEGKISTFRLVLRNVFLIIWPVELLILLFDPCQRLGDKVSGTAVVMTDREDKMKLLTKDYIAFVVILLLMYALCFYTIVSLFAGGEVILHE